MWLVSAAADCTEGWWGTGRGQKSIRWRWRIVLRKNCEKFIRMGEQKDIAQRTPALYKYKTVKATRISVTTRSHQYNFCCPVFASRQPCQTSATSAKAITNAPTNIISKPMSVHIRPSRLPCSQKLLKLYRFCTGDRYEKVDPGEEPCVRSVLFCSVSQ